MVPVFNNGKPYLMYLMESIDYHHMLSSIDGCVLAYFCDALTYFVKCVSVGIPICEKKNQLQKQ
jgi:hypothetical protein